MPIKTLLWIFVIILIFVATILWFSKTAHSEVSVTPQPQPYLYIESTHSPMDTFGIELAKKTTTSKYILCSCVNFAKFIIHGTAYLGTSWGYAGNMKPQHKKPKIGDVILLEGHVGVVVNFDDQNITFTESNYESCKKTIRTLPINDGSIRGYSTL